MTDTPTDARVLDRLFSVIDSRRGGNPDASYTAWLLEKGPPKAAQKVGEEAIETVIAALDHDERALAEESADLLYHLLVLWAARGLDPSQVWDALAAREGISGLVEKAARKED
ncbi:MAG: phosphoribosyl-ATP diphosphatase [Pseudomonadota bacterium]|nr:phosphoribosyl-ATP diphosphatase [Pseudomonadota bacterium]